MNKSLKPVFIMAVLAIFGVANAQIKVTAPKVEVTAPAAHTAPAAPTAPAVTAPTAPAAPAAHTAPAEPTAPAVAVPATPAVPAAHTPTVPAAPAIPAAHTPAAPKAEATAPKAADSASTPIAEAQATPKIDSTIVLIIEEPKAEEPKKKKRSSRAPKNDFAVVDVPANFEIQARKNFPIAERFKDKNDPTNNDPVWSTNNLDTWWGRANLMVLTESENFVGKVHLRIYPGQLYGSTPTVATAVDSTSTDRYGNLEAKDIFQLYEAWAWHRGDYVNVKIGRWDNTTRFGSKTFGGYVDAKKDKNKDKKICNGSDECLNPSTKEQLPRKSINIRPSGFMSTYAPENALQFGLNNFSENISLDIALISGDKHLNRGDLRVYFAFKDLAGLENVDIGIGYRSNVFDGIYNKRSDITHTVDFGFRMPLIKEAGLLKNLNLFAEAALIGLDDQIGSWSRADEGGSPHSEGCDPTFPILGGLDFSFYRGLDKIVIEAEYDGNRKNATGDSHYKGSKTGVKDVLGSIYAQKILNDRFTLNMGIQSENNTKDFSYALRLQGRIN